MPSDLELITSAALDILSHLPEIMSTVILVLSSNLTTAPPLLLVGAESDDVDDDEHERLVAKADAGGISLTFGD